MRRDSRWSSSHDGLVFGCARQLSMATRIAIPVFGSIAVYVALEVQVVYDLILDANSVILVSVTIPFIAAVWWRKANRSGALASMVTGFLCVPLFKFVLPILPEWGPHFVELEELAPSFLLSLLAGVLATKLSQRRTRQ